jgi:hypothetical protein
MIYISHKISFVLAPYILSNSLIHRLNKEEIQQGNEISQELIVLPPGMLFSLFSKGAKFCE